ncbi:GNAT family N-acetyltransferase [Paenibacillus sp. oral taxon 786]|uniref:GNAT family N-acetyltransferase n=1 Tax=Paenibacillus sp. oral taxon 786 TaxID=652715 RepID=UPI0002E6B304|nr:GNAT family N-acetyltransferase [Paenibacillus sp. oral taxon 786]
MYCRIRRKASATKLQALGKLVLLIMERQEKPVRPLRQRRFAEPGAALTCCCSPLTLGKVQRSASFVFPPGIADIRPFVWSGFIAEVKYTYIVELPYEIDQASTEIRAKIKKATAAGYWTALTQDMAEVYQCLQGTETRQGFSHHLTQQDLELAQSLLGDQAFRAYVCYAPNGEPVSTSVVVSLDGRRAFGWIAASKTEHLNLGVVQQSQSFALQDLSDLGFAEFDFAGANLPTVAYSKTNWGGRVTPYYLIRSPGLKEIFRAGRDWMRFVRRSRQPL